MSSKEYPTRYSFLHIWSQLSDKKWKIIFFARKHDTNISIMNINYHMLGLIIVRFPFLTLGESTNSWPKTSRSSSVSWDMIFWHKCLDTGLVKSVPVRNHTGAANFFPPSTCTGSNSTRQTQHRSSVSRLWHVVVWLSHGLCTMQSYALINVLALLAQYSHEAFGCAKDETLLKSLSLS